jgi:hypothetical protein
MIKAAVMIKVAVRGALFGYRRARGWRVTCRMCGQRHT